MSSSCLLPKLRDITGCILPLLHPPPRAYSSPHHRLHMQRHNDTDIICSTRPASFLSISPELNVNLYGNSTLACLLLNNA